MVLDRDHYRHGLADVRRQPIALARGTQMLRPRACQKPAQQHHAQQHIHRVGQQAEPQRQAGGQQQHGGQEPFHDARASAERVGTGISPRISSTIAVAVTFRSRLSGRTINRCVSTAGAIRLTSSGSTKLRPRIAAIA